MAITATYKTSAVEYKDAYIRIERIWGSKSEGWNAWVAVYEKEGEKAYKELFSVNVPYVEGENPFTALYSATEQLSFVLTPDKIVAPVVAPLATEIGMSPTEYVAENAAPVQQEIQQEEIKPKKSRKKK